MHKKFDLLLQIFKLLTIIALFQGNYSTTKLRLVIISNLVLSLKFHDITLGCHANHAHFTSHYLTNPVFVLQNVPFNCHKIMIYPIKIHYACNNILGKLKCDKNTSLVG